MASDLWMSSTETTKVASLLMAVRMPSIPSRLPPRILMRLPTFRKPCEVNGMLCESTVRIVSISQSGTGAPNPCFPTKPLTPVVRSTGIRAPGLGEIRTNAYCGNSGDSTRRWRSLHCRFSPNNGRKTLTPFSRSSEATFFSWRGQVWIANQEFSVSTDRVCRLGPAGVLSEL